MYDEGFTELYRVSQKKVSVRKNACNCLTCTLLDDDLYRSSLLIHQSPANTQLGNQQKTETGDAIFKPGLLHQNEYCFYGVMCVQKYYIKMYLYLL